MGVRQFSIMMIGAVQEMGCKMDHDHAYMKGKELKELSEHQQAGDSVDKEQLAIPRERNDSKVNSNS